MDQYKLPQIPAFKLDRSLNAAEAIAERAVRTDDHELRRVLLKSSCDVLDYALTCSEPTRVRRGADRSPAGRG